MKVVTIVGARPQFMKAAVVSREFLKDSTVEELIVHTGQHYDANMSDIFFKQLEIPQPRYNLEIGSGTHGLQTGQMLSEIEKVLLAEKPDWVLVYGDTNSTLAGAVAAVKLHIPVAHVEAGLRSFNRNMPEEINRVLTDHASSLLFAPTTTAVANLQREGVTKGVHQTGDVMYDAAMFYSQKAQAESNVLVQLGLAAKQYILTTIHRAENTDDPQRLGAIVKGLAEVAKTLPVVLPLHPRTHKLLGQLGWLTHLEEALNIIEPVGYLDMVVLEKNAALIATDSGGVQKEAFFYHVPCVTLRDETEWVELLETQWNTLVLPTTAQQVAQGILSRLGTTGQDVKLYGDGASAKQIVRLLR